MSHEFSLKQKVVFSHKIDGTAFAASRLTEGEGDTQRNEE